MQGFFEDLGDEPSVEERADRIPSNEELQAMYAEMYGLSAEADAEADRIEQETRDEEDNFNFF